MRSKSTFRKRTVETGKNNNLSIKTLNNLNKFIYKENREKFITNRDKNKADNILKLDTKDINSKKENIHPIKYYDAFRISEKNYRNTPSKQKTAPNHFEIENENKKLKKKMQN